MIITYNENKGYDQQENGLDMYSKFPKLTLKEMKCNWLEELNCLSYSILDNRETSYLKEHPLLEFAEIFLYCIWLDFV